MTNRTCNKTCVRCDKKACADSVHFFHNEIKHENGMSYYIDLDFRLNGIDLCHKCMLWVFATSKEN